MRRNGKSKEREKKRTRFVPTLDFVARQRVDQLVLVKVEAAVRVLLLQFPASVAEQLVVRDLDFKRFRLPLLIQGHLGRGDERDGLAGGFGGEDVGEGNVLYGGEGQLRECEKTSWKRGSDFETILLSDAIKISASGSVIHATSSALMVIRDVDLKFHTVRILDCTALRRWNRLTPAGIPPVAKLRISSAVKSGRWNVSTSYSLPHGKSVKMSGAASTSALNFLLCSFCGMGRCTARVSH